MVAFLFQSLHTAVHTFTSTYSIPRTSTKLSQKPLITPKTCRFTMSMIEIERKFRVSPEIRFELEQRCSSRSMVKLKDRYWCEELALQDKWLRQRNGKWELKVPILQHCTRRPATTVYRELVEPRVWEEVSRMSIEVENLAPYATLHTERTTLQCVWDSHKIEVVLDACRSDDGFQYTIGELEILVEKESQVEDAAASLDQFAQSLKLKTQGEGDGKLIAYLKEKKSALYNALAAKGLI